MPTQVALLGNVTITVAYAAIAMAIFLPLVRAGQVMTNRLATATALIFFSCAVGHGFHALAAGQAIAGHRSMDRMHMASAGWPWPSAVWDLFTAGVGVYYWSLRRGYGVLLSRGGLYVDAGQQRILDEGRERERVAVSRTESRRAALAAVVEQSDDAITGMTLDGVVTAWNCGAERMFGYTTTEAVGAPATSFFADGSVDHDGLTARVAAGEHGIHYEEQVCHKDGSIVEVAVALSPIFDDTGAVVGVSRIARDLTAMKQAQASQRTAEERVRQCQHMASLGQLAGGVAHDFNNLLGIILNFTAFASEETAEDDAVQADLTQVRLAAERAAGLARQLLTFTRQDTVRPEVLDVNAAIAESQAMLTRTIGEHIELVAVPAPTPIMIYADAGHVQQIIVNLAVNARDAMPDGGTLVIEATEADLSEVGLDQGDGTPPSTLPGGRYVRLLISDTGTGMSPDVVARIFEPYFTTKPRGRGTGIGLATVHGIVAEAGGSITVSSAPGIGTTFQVYFPVADVRARPEPTRPDTMRARRGHGQTVLVVEDEPALARAIARILDDAGYRTLTANVGPQALALHAENGCDLVLTDVILPEMSGQRLAELLHRRDPDLRVLYMSGYTDGLLGSARILDQRIAFIKKPFTARLLLTHVEKIFTADRTASASMTADTMRAG